MVSNYAVIEAGVVTNAVIAEELFAAERGWVPMPEGVSRGWTYDGHSFQAPPAPVPPVPAAISFAQLLIGLVSESWVTEAEGEAWLAGTLPAPVLALIASLPASEQFAAKARASRPSEVRRDDPLVAGMATGAGKTAAELDAFFIKYGAV